VKILNQRKKASFLKFSCRQKKDMANRPHQDWTEVKLKPKSKPATAKQQDVKAALQKDPNSVTTVKKGRSAPFNSLRFQLLEARTGNMLQTSTRGVWTKMKATTKVFHVRTLAYLSENSWTCCWKSHFTSQAGQGFDSEGFSSGTTFLLLL
jgi:hypothetical protein